MDPTRTALRPLDHTTDVRSAGDIGRRARLELRFAERNGRTFIAHSYAEPPFRVGASFQSAEGLHLIVASSAPGIFGGDHFEQTIVVERGARVRLTSQSAMQLHPAAGGTCATLSSTYRVESGAALQCEWDPVIPFSRARLDQRIEIDLAGDATLFWSDAVMSGREARGERWEFERLAHELCLVRAGSLVYLERYLLSPAERAVDRPWLGEDACYFGTALAVNCGVSQIALDALQEEIAPDGAADRLGDGIVLVRLMAASGVTFHEARMRVRNRLTAQGLRSEVRGLY